MLLNCYKPIIYYICANNTNFMHDSVLKTSGDVEVFSYEYIERLRQKRSDKRIIAQRGCQEKFLATNADITIFGGNRGGPLLVDTKVVTPFGYRRIGDLKAGDIISATDGGMQRVVYRQDHGKLPAYRLTFIDGSSVIASYDHLWNVRRTCYISKKRHLNGLDLKDDWRVWTTQMIVDFLQKKKDGDLKNGHIVVPLCEPVKFTQGIGRGRRPNFDPYIYGALLGDGCTTDTVIKQGKCLLESEPNQVVEEFELAGIDMGNIRYKEGSLSNSYAIRNESLIEDLIYFDIAGHGALDKYVHKYFLFGNVDERWAILQGLMDTDGTVDSRGHCSFTSISEQLAKDVKFLVNSLGGVATISKHEAGYRNEEGEYVRCNDAYEVYIRIKDSERLFRLPYKKARCREYNGGISEYTRRIVDFEYLGEQECCCIAVDNANSLFMVEDFIVTHNSKSFSLLMESLKDIRNSHFNAILLRNERDDLIDLVNTSYQLYSPFGQYNRSINDMTWNFYNGGKLKFSYYAGGYEDFETRFRGRQYSYIGIDEITQIAYKKFKFLVTCNRNAYGIRNRFYGTCNPDPDSWVRKFIDWWIDEEGLPIPERDGIIRYCFMDGDTPDQIYWGASPEEVYAQCKDIIDPLWKDEYEALGFNKITMFVKSATFIKGKLEENIALISSDPNYVANLAQQDEEQRARDLEGNWNFKRTGDDMIKMEDMERFFAASSQTGGARYVSADIAFEGGDFCVMWLWDGLHIKDIFVMRENSANTEKIFAAKLLEWGVREENVVYDYWGVGQALSGHFRRAVKFTGTERPKEPFDRSYKNVKSQCAEMLAHYIQDGKISIEPRLLDLRFNGKKGKYSNTPLRQILMKERKCIRHKDNSSIGGFELVNKEGMIKAVGYSPDFFESLIYRMIFEIKTKHRKPKGLLRYTKPIYR